MQGIVLSNTSLGDGATISAEDATALVAQVNVVPRINSDV